VPAGDRRGVPVTTAVGNNADVADDVIE